MKTLPFLSGEHANILVLLCYENLNFISELEGVRTRKIVNIKREALLCLRFACGDNYKKENPPAPFQVLRNMARCCETNIDNITYQIDRYIAEYMNGREKEYWHQIPKKSKYPTAAELLVFLYANYDCDILLLPYGGIF